MRILIVEDDCELAGELKRLLVAGGHGVRRFRRGDCLPLDSLEEHFDVAILDVGLPGMDGFGVVQAMREAGVGLPVLFLSARGDVRDRVKGLEAGGDDYLVKPYSAEELMARLDAICRRSGGRGAKDSSAPKPTIDLARRRYVEGALSIELQPKELALLSVFLQHEGQTLTKGFLLDKVWDIRFDPGTNVVDAMICRVRGKMESEGLQSRISTIRGKGYVFCSGN
jgi:DNA-binding response OmpR family regulator